MYVQDLFLNKKKAESKKLLQPHYADRPEFHINNNNSKKKNRRKKQKRTFAGIDIFFSCYFTILLNVILRYAGT